MAVDDFSNVWHDSIACICICMHDTGFVIKLEETSHEDNDSVK